MTKLNKLFMLFSLLGLGSCGVLKNEINYNDIPDGKYHAKVFATRKVYVENRNDSLFTYKLNKEMGEYTADTTNPFIRIFPHKTNDKIESYFFNALTLDLDALTIPFKYRPETKSLPQQFTTSLNGAVYFGIRNDSYKLKYKKQFFNYFQRECQHYAISIGGFMGFGSTVMNPWVTEKNITKEYEGVVWLKGAAVIMAVGKYTSGISIGWDSLLDENKKFWIYEKKPWIGLVFGLNLN